MALSEREKQTVIDYLDRLDDAAKMIVLASIEAFGEWLANALYSIYLKINNALNQFWNWLRSIL